MREVFKPGNNAKLLILLAVIIFGLAGSDLLAMDREVAGNPLYYSGRGKLATSAFDAVTCNIGNIENYICNSTYTKATGTQEWTVLLGDDAQSFPSMVWKTPAVYQNNSYLYFGSIRVCYNGHQIHFAEDRGTNITEKTPSTDATAVSSYDTEFYIDDQSSIVPPDYQVGFGAREKTYAWAESYRDDFIIYDFWLYNLSGVDMDSVYVGFHCDADVSTAEGGSGDQQWSIDDLPGYYRDDVTKEYISYVYDGDNPSYPGDDLGGHLTPKESSGYIGTRLLYCPARTGQSADDTTTQSGHGWWNWNSDPSEQNGYEDYFDLVSDGRWEEPPPAPFDYRYFQKAGPFVISADDSIRIVYAFGVGEGIEGLRENLEWADYLYEHDWIGPSAPTSPTYTVAPGDGQVTITWDSLAEYSVDPYSHETDFEGYRLWRRTDAGWSLLMECDLINDMGFNTGLVHSYVDYTVSNYFLYSYAVTAYDKGDPGNDIESLESGVGVGQSVEPGVYSLTADEANSGIHVVPNPFVAQSAPNFGFTPTFTNPSTERIVFVNLPANSTVRIYTLTGDLITTLRNTEDVAEGWKTTASWDLITDKRQTIVAGLYLYHVEAPSIDDFIDKFAVVR